MALLSPEINILGKICNKVSKIIIRDFGEVERLQVSKKGPGDFVTKTDKKVEKIIDNFLLNLILYNENYLGNLNGLFKIKFDKLNNKLIKKGEIKLIINEKYYISLKI